MSYFFHASDPCWRDSILRDGLLASDPNPRWWRTGRVGIFAPVGVYLAPSPEWSYASEDLWLVEIEPQEDWLPDPFIRGCTVCPYSVHPDQLALARLGDPFARRRQILHTVDGVILGAAA